MRKNVSSQKMAIYAYDTVNDEGKTGDAANITAQISKDAGASAAVADTNPTELDATDHPGIYIFDISQAKSNADLIIITASSTTANIVIDPVIINTLPFDSNNRVDVGKWLGTAVTLSAVNSLPDVNAKKANDDALITLAQINAEDDTAISDAIAAIVDAICDEVITAAAHGTADSLAYYLRRLHQTSVSRIDQCGDAGTATTIDLDASASAVNDFYKGQIIVITAGTGAGQARACISYNGTTKIATINPAWATNPDGDSWFAVVNLGSVVVAAVSSVPSLGD